MFLICDAPCHGKQYQDKGVDDSYPKGCPNGLKLETLMNTMHKMNIGFTCIKLEESCNKMIQLMKQYHPETVVTDLTGAVATKTKEEITKIFVDSATVILRDKVGGRDADGNKRTPTKLGKPLWNPSDL